MKSERKYYGVYKVRRLGRNEQSIKVPSTITGDFALYVEPNGTMTYEPVGKP
jgi:hypothetical protein